MSNTSSAATAKFGGSHSGPVSSNTSIKENNQQPDEKVRPTLTQVDDFPRLVEQMKHGSLAVLLLEQVIDFTVLTRKLLQIVYSVVMFWSRNDVQ